MESLSAKKRKKETTTAPRNKQKHIWVLHCITIVVFFKYITISNIFKYYGGNVSQPCFWGAITRSPLQETGSVSTRDKGGGHFRLRDLVS